MTFLPHSISSAAQSATLPSLRDALLRHRPSAWALNRLRPSWEHRSPSSIASKFLAWHSLHAPSFLASHLRWQIPHPLILPRPQSANSELNCSNLSLTHTRSESASNCFEKSFEQQLGRNAKSIAFECSSSPSARYRLARSRQELKQLESIQSKVTGHKRTNRTQTSSNLLFFSFS